MKVLLWIAVYLCSVLFIAGCLWIGSRGND